MAALRATGRLGECRRQGRRRRRLTRRGRCPEPQDRRRRRHRRPGRRQGRDRHGLGRGAHRPRRRAPPWVKNSNGDTWIGEVTGDARAQRGERHDHDRSGRRRRRREDRERPRAPRARSRAAPRSPQSAFGDLEIGVRDGVAGLARPAHEVRARAQRARRVGATPAIGEDAVEVRAHTSMGDIVDPPLARQSAGSAS